MAKSHEEFLLIAYCGLVLRGYDKPADIEDLILREVWRRGKSIAIKYSTEARKTKGARSSVGARRPAKRKRGLGQVGRDGGRPAGPRLSRGKRGESNG
jgi:hypothetical protein